MKAISIQSREIVISSDHTTDEECEAFGESFLRGMSNEVLSRKYGVGVEVEGATQAVEHNGMSYGIHYANGEPFLVSLCCLCQLESGAREAQAYFWVLKTEELNNG